MEESSSIKSMNGRDKYVPSLEKILRELKNKEVPVKMITPLGDFYGYVEDVGKKKVYLKPYIAEEPIILSGIEISRYRIENDFPLPLDISGIIPMVMSEKAIYDHVVMSNYESYITILNEQLRESLFAGYPFPDLPKPKKEEKQKGTKKTEEEIRDQIIRGKIGFVQRYMLESVRPSVKTSKNSKNNPRNKKR